MTPRPPLPLGTWGKVSRKKFENGRWRATARYRDIDGVTRTTEAWGKTGAAAERSLLTAFQGRQAPTNSDISRTTRLSDLSKLWFDEIEQNGRAGRRTIDGYRDTYRRVIEPLLAGLRLHELSTGRIDRFLKYVAADHPATARHSKIVLTGMIGLAVRHDALPSNPVRDVGPIKVAKKDVRVLNVNDVQNLRKVIHDWQLDPDHQGRPRATDLLDVLDIFLATGARIGEVLAIRWKDINLEKTPPTITISGTVIQEKGRGAYRQERPKTRAGYRTVKLPPFAAEMLQQKHLATRPDPGAMLFPSSTGTVRSPHNFRRQWRDARAGSAYEWVTPHVFRKSVATLIDQEYSSKQAAAQLGHSGTAITEKHYIAKASESPDLTQALQKFGSEQPSDRNGKSI
jgi:integrase